MADESNPTAGDGVEGQAGGEASPIQKPGVNNVPLPGGTESAASPEPDSAAVGNTSSSPPANKHPSGQDVHDWLSQRLRDINKRGRRSLWRRLLDKLFGRS